MKIFQSCFVLILCVFLGNQINGQIYDGKYNDGIYKEEDVPEYELPDVLTGFDGEMVTSVEQWEDFRRPEILDFFAYNMYGKVPSPPDPIIKSFELIEENANYLEGLCTKRRISIIHKNKYGEVSMPMLLFIPNDAKGPVPSIFLFNGDDIRRDRLEIDSPQRYGSTRNGVPLVQLMEKGIALITIDGNAFGRGFGIEGGKVKGGIVNLFFEPGQNYTKEDEWGLIAVWAYAISAGMDYVETDTDIHPEKVAVLGCSVNGKVALWAAANDTRISMVLSATTGHGGDAIWRRQFGETLENMCIHLPSWICRNACKYASDINSLPVDQHTLLATIAPRPLYVGTAELDLWADQKGQWIATYHAAPIYRLYGEKVAFTSPEQPPLNNPIKESAIGYYVRSGYHGLTYYDWERYIEFIEYHFMTRMYK
jgi:hypothetical protein